nr:MAG TPA: hypothetical protein [Caudoviricetes sp.]DAX00747.1 MAG TPA: hypothetical protein [Bacteriophage sp.]
MQNNYPLSVTANSFIPPFLSTVEKASSYSFLLKFAIFI